MREEAATGRIWLGQLMNDTSTAQHPHGDPIYRLNIRDTPKLSLDCP